MIRADKNSNQINNFRKLNMRDIFNIIVSVIGIAIATIQMFETRQFKVIIYNISICVIIVLVNIFAFTNKHREIKAKINIKKLEEKNKNLLEVNDDVRCFKHDFNNIMQAINGYIDLKDINALEKYFNSVIKDCHHINTVELLNYQVIDNPALYAVLLNKYTIAKENNIMMNIDICMSLSAFEEKAYNISRILGILLDNAIEATNECKERIINVQFYKERNKNLIVIENTFVDKNIDTDKMYEKGFSSKKAKGNSGLGLWKIKNIIRKEECFNLLTDIEDDMFRQKLEVYT